MRDYIFNLEVSIMNKNVKIVLGTLGGVFAAYCIYALGYNMHMKKKNPKVEKLPKHTSSYQVYTVE